MCKDSVMLLLNCYSCTLNQTIIHVQNAFISCTSAKFTSKKYLFTTLKMYLTSPDGRIGEYKYTKWEVFVKILSFKLPSDTCITKHGYH